MKTNIQINRTFPNIFVVCFETTRKFHFFYYERKKKMEMKDFFDLELERRKNIWITTKEFLPINS